MTDRHRYEAAQSILTEIVSIWKCNPSHPLPPELIKEIEWLLAVPPLKQAAAKVGLTEQALRSRLFNGESLREALTPPRLPSWRTFFEENDRRNGTATPRTPPR